MKDNVSTTNVSKRAKASVIKLLEYEYMNLEMEIDNCQGCMVDLDVAFEILNIYKDVVKYLGGDIDAHKQELIDNWFKDNTQTNNQNTNNIDDLKLNLVKLMKIAHRFPYNLIDVLIDQFVDIQDKINEMNNKLNKL